MAEIAVLDEYLFIFERVLLALYYFFPYKPISSLLFLFACTTFFFYSNFQRRLQSCYTDLNYGLGLLFVLERNVSAAFILLLCYFADEIFFLIYFAAIFVPVSFLYMFHEKNRWMVDTCINIIRKKMNQLAAIVSTVASTSDKKSKKKINAEPGVGDPEIASATDQRSEKKMIGESVDAILEVGSSKNSAFSKKHSTERNNDRSNGASARRRRRQSRKKNIAEEVEASSEIASPCDTGEDHPQIVEQKTEDGRLNDDTERTSSETGIVGFSTTGSDQLLKTSSSQFLEEERIKWEEEREKLQRHLDFISKVLTLTSKNRQEIRAQYMEEKKKWETEKRQLTQKLEDSASISRLMAFYKGKCQSLQIEKNLAAADQTRSKEKPFINPDMFRFSDLKSHCKAIEDYLIELEDRNARVKRDLLEKIEESEIHEQQYIRLINELRKQKLTADAAVEMANAAAADSQRRILELERHCRLCADQC